MIGLIYVFANTILLGVGGYLVSLGQLSLGQLVAAELLVNIILAGVLRINGYLEEFYDMTAAVEKVSSVMSLPTEDIERIDQEGLQDFSTLSNMSVKDTSGQKGALEFSLDRGEQILLIGGIKPVSELGSVFLGFDSNRETLKIKLNDMPLSAFRIKDIRAKISVVKGIELFAGTLRENLILNKKENSLEEAHQLMKYFSLEDKLMSLPKQLETYVSGHQLMMDMLTLQKITLIRVLLARPELIILENVLDMIPEDEIEGVIKGIKAYSQSAIISSERRIFLPPHIPNHQEVGA